MLNNNVNNDKKIKKVKTKYDIAYSCMLVVAFLIIIGTGTYAYYRSTMTGTTSGTIAKWSFTANNQASTFSLDLGGLYPGKTDVKYIELSAENSDLPVLFAVIMNIPNYLNSDGNFDNEIDMLKFASLYGRTYFDNSFTHNFITDQTVGYFGVLLGGETVTVPIYYNWPYDADAENSFVLDSDVQNIADGRLLTNNISVVGYQMDISNAENFNASQETFLMGINYQCSTGSYAYSNKFGYPCNDFILYPNENAQDMIQAGPMVDYELDDGSTIEFYKYFIAGLSAVPGTID